MVWAVVPVKNLDKAKQRFAGVLSPAQRQRLCIAMLKDVLCCLKNASTLEGVAVVTSDLRVGPIVHSSIPEAKIIRETGKVTLNGALHQAAVFLKDNLGAEGMFVIHGDLPLLTPDDIDRAVLYSKNKGLELMAIPDKIYKGTNGLLIKPPDLIYPKFGPGSLKEHIAEARKNNLSYEVILLQSFMYDMDYPADLLAVTSKNYSNLQTYFEVLPIKDI